MKRLIWIAVVAGLGMTLGLMSVQARAEKTEDLKGLPSAPLDIAGVWLGTSPVIPDVYTQPITITTVITPTESSGHRFAYVASGMNGDPAFMGLFPDATQLATQVGTIVRTGPRTYYITSIQYFWKPPAPGVEGPDGFGTWDRGQVLYFFVNSGPLELKDANTIVSEGTMSFYSKVDRGPVEHWLFNAWGITELHNQDKDNGGIGDGLPDEGETPFVCFPFEGEVLKRMPLMEPCAPPPM